MSSVSLNDEFEWQTPESIYFILSCLLFMVLFLYFIFYSSVVTGWLVGRLLSWFVLPKARYLKIGHVQLSLVGGRILFRDVVYATENTALRIVAGTVSFRWWSSSARIRRTAAEPGLPCRLSIALEGLEVLIYNNTFRTDELEAAIARRGGGAVDIGEADKESPNGADRDVDMVAAALQEVVNEAGVPQYLTVSPVTQLSLRKSCVYIGNPYLKSVAVMTFGQVDGVYSIESAHDSRDLFRNITQVECIDVRLRPIPSPHYNMSEELLQPAPVRIQDDFVAYAYGNLRALVDDVKGAFTDADSRFPASPPRTPGFEASPNQPPPEEWTGLRRYRTDAKFFENDEVYAHRMSVEYVQDQPGLVRRLSPTTLNSSGHSSLNDGQDSSADAGDGGDDAEPFDASSAPRWCMKVTFPEGLVGTFSTYSNKRRDEMQRFFFPFDYQNRTLYQPVVGQSRVFGGFQVEVTIRKSTRVRIPFEKQLPRSASDSSPTANPVQVNRGQKKRRSKRSRNNQEQPQDRTAEWVELRSNGEAHISYFMPWTRTASFGGEASFNILLPEIEVSSSLTDDEEAMLSARALRVDSAFGYPEVWNSLTESRYTVSFDKPRYFVVYEQLMLLQHLSADWIDRSVMVDLPHFIPTRTIIRIKLSEYELLFNANEKNIRSGPLHDLTCNAHIGFAGPQLDATVIFPFDRFHDDISIIPFEICTRGVGVYLKLPVWHSVFQHCSSMQSHPLGLRMFRTRNDVFISGQCTLHQTISTEHFNSAEINFRGSGIETIAFGFVMRYLSILRENFIGDFYFVRTVDNFQKQKEKQREDVERMLRKLSAVARGGIESNIPPRQGASHSLWERGGCAAPTTTPSNSWEVVFHLALTNISIQLPLAMYRAKPALFLDLSSVVIELRNQCSSLEANISVACVTLRDSHSRAVLPAKIEGQSHARHRRSRPTSNHGDVTMSRVAGQTSTFSESRRKDRAGVSTTSVWRSLTEQSSDADFSVSSFSFRTRMLYGPSPARATYATDSEMHLGVVCGVIGILDVTNLAQFARQFSFYFNDASNAFGSTAPSVSALRPAAANSFHAVVDGVGLLIFGLSPGTDETQSANTSVVLGGFTQVSVGPGTFVADSLADKMRTHSLKMLLEPIIVEHFVPISDAVNSVSGGLHSAVLRSLSHGSSVDDAILAAVFVTGVEIAMQFGPARSKQDRAKLRSYLLEQDRQTKRLRRLYVSDWMKSPAEMRRTALDAQPPQPSAQQTSSEEKSPQQQDLTEFQSDTSTEFESAASSFASALSDVEVGSGNGSDCSNGKSNTFSIVDSDFDGGISFLVPVAIRQNSAHFWADMKAHGARAQRRLVVPQATSKNLVLSSSGTSKTSLYPQDCFSPAQDPDELVWPQLESQTLSNSFGEILLKHEKTHRGPAPAATDASIPDAIFDGLRSTVQPAFENLSHGVGSSSLSEDGLIFSDDGSMDDFGFGDSASASATANVHSRSVTTKDKKKRKPRRHTSSRNAMNQDPRRVFRNVVPECQGDDGRLYVAVNIVRRTECSFVLPHFVESLCATMSGITARGGDRSIHLLLDSLQNRLCRAGAPVIRNIRTDAADLASGASCPRPVPLQRNNRFSLFAADTSFNVVVPKPVGGIGVASDEFYALELSFTDVACTAEVVTEYVMLDNDLLDLVDGRGVLCSGVNSSVAGTVSAGKMRAAWFALDPVSKSLINEAYAVMDSFEFAGQQILDNPLHNESALSARMLFSCIDVFVDCPLWQSLVPSLLLLQSSLAVLANTVRSHIETRRRVFETTVLNVVKFCSDNPQFTYEVYNFEGTEEEMEFIFRETSVLHYRSFWRQLSLVRQFLANVSVSVFKDFDSLIVALGIGELESESGSIRTFYEFVRLSDTALISQFGPLAALRDDFRRAFVPSKEYVSTAVNFAVIAEGFRIGLLSEKLEAERQGIHWPLREHNTIASTLMRLDVTALIMQIPRKNDLTTSKSSVNLTFRGTLGRIDGLFIAGAIIPVLSSLIDSISSCQHLSGTTLHDSLVDRSRRQTSVNLGQLSARTRHAPLTERAFSVNPRVARGLRSLERNNPVAKTAFGFHVEAVADEELTQTGTSALLQSDTVALQARRSPALQVLKTTRTKTDTAFTINGSCRVGVLVLRTALDVTGRKEVAHYFIFEVESITLSPAVWLNQARSHSTGKPNVVLSLLLSVSKLSSKVRIQKQTDETLFSHIFSDCVANFVVREGGRSVSSKHNAVVENFFDSILSINSTKTAVKIPQFTNLYFFLNEWQAAIQRGVIARISQNFKGSQQTASTLSVPDVVYRTSCRAVISRYLLVLHDTPFVVCYALDDFHVSFQPTAFRENGSPNVIRSSISCADHSAFVLDRKRINRVGRKVQKAVEQASKHSKFTLPAWTAVFLFAKTSGKVDFGIASHLCVSAIQNTLTAELLSRFLLLQHNVSFHYQRALASYHVFTERRKERLAVKRQSINASVVATRSQVWSGVYFNAVMHFDGMILICLSPSAAVVFRSGIVDLSIKSDRLKLMRKLLGQTGQQRSDKSSIPVHSILEISGLSVTVEKPTEQHENVGLPSLLCRPEVVAGLILQVSCEVRPNPRSDTDPTAMKNLLHLTLSNTTGVAFSSSFDSLTSIFEHYSGAYKAGKATASIKALPPTHTTANAQFADPMEDRFDLTVHIENTTLIFWLNEPARIRGKACHSRSKSRSRTKKHAALKHDPVLRGSSLLLALRDLTIKAAYQRLKHDNVAFASGLKMTGFGKFSELRALFARDFNLSDVDAVHRGKARETVSASNVRNSATLHSGTCDLGAKLSSHPTSVESCQQLIIAAIAKTEKLTVDADSSVVEDYVALRNALIRSQKKWKTFSELTELEKKPTSENVAASSPSLRVVLDLRFESDFGKIALHTRRGSKVYIPIPPLMLAIHHVFVPTSESSKDVTSDSSSRFKFKSSDSEMHILVDVATSNIELDPALTDVIDEVVRKLRFVTIATSAPQEPQPRVQDDEYIVEKLQPYLSGTRMLTLRLNRTRIKLACQPYTDVECHLDIGPLDLFLSSMLERTSPTDSVLLSNATLWIQNFGVRVLHPQFPHEHSFAFKVHNLRGNMGQAYGLRKDRGAVASLLLHAEELRSHISLRHIDDFLLFARVWHFVGRPNDDTPVPGQNSAQMANDGSASILAPQDWLSLFVHSRVDTMRFETDLGTATGTGWVQTNSFRCKLDFPGRLRDVNMAAHESSELTIALQTEALQAQFQGNLEGESYMKRFQCVAQTRFRHGTNFCSLQLSPSSLNLSYNMAPILWWKGGATGLTFRDDLTDTELMDSAFRSSSVTMLILHSELRVSCDTVQSVVSIWGRLLAQMQEKQKSAKEKYWLALGRSRSTSEATLQNGITHFPRSLPRVQDKKQLPGSVVPVLGTVRILGTNLRLSMFGLSMRDHKWGYFAMESFSIGLHIERKRSKHGVDIHRRLVIAVGGNRISQKTNTRDDNSAFGSSVPDNSIVANIREDEISRMPTAHVILHSIQTVGSDTITVFFLSDFREAIWLKLDVGLYGFVQELVMLYVRVIRDAGMQLARLNNDRANETRPGRPSNGGDRQWVIPEDGFVLDPKLSILGERTSIQTVFRLLGVQKMRMTIPKQLHRGIIDSLEALLKLQADICAAADKIGTAAAARSTSQT